MLASLKLAGLLDPAEGIILGDFHTPQQNLSEAVFRLLRHHLPRTWRRPIISLETFGHIYPIAPLPMHRAVTLRRLGGSRVRIDIPWAEWAGR